MHCETGCDWSHCRIVFDYKLLFTNNFVSVKTPNKLATEYIQAQTTVWHFPTQKLDKKMKQDMIGLN